MNSPDHPDLTAYALGELDAEHAEAMSRWLTENPEAGAEVDALHDLGQRLQSTAPAAVHVLHPHQRTAVITGPQKVRQMVAAVQATRRRPSYFAPIAYGISRVAAAAVLVIGGFLAGTHIANQGSGTLATSSRTLVPSPQPDLKQPPVAPAPASPQPFKAKEVPQVAVVQTPVESPARPDAPRPIPAPEPTVEFKQPVVEVAVASAPVAAATPKEHPKATIALLPKTEFLSEPFVSTSKTAVAQAVLRPADSRFVAQRGTEPTAAAPMVNQPKTIEAAPHGKQPDLLIHSWKAEVASCPWNDTHRLLRLAIQIPGEQAAAATGASYPLQVNFSPNHVRNYRQICHRTVPASAVDAPAFHIVWYEFQPNSQASEGAAKAIGSVTLANARFTTAVTGPFDGSKLQVVDRGTEWSAARDDFLFESALVGFRMLLTGEKDAGSLDLGLVLDLAQRTVGDDRTGERAKFLKLVQDAQRSAGL